MDFRATGRLRGAIMSAGGCLGCKLLPEPYSSKTRGAGESGKWGMKGAQGSGESALWVMFDASPQLPMPGKRRGGSRQGGHEGQLLSAN